MTSKTGLQPKISSDLQPKVSNHQPITSNLQPKTNSLRRKTRNNYPISKYPKQRNGPRASPPSWRQ